jgi:hypothetical protein
MEFNIYAEPFQQPDRRLSRLGKERVVITRNKQRCPHLVAA